jgi:hypothetical protein
MARYGKETKLPPKAVLAHARSFFGPDGDLGLPIISASWNEVRFEGGGGGVEVTALPRAGELGTTEVTVLSREYDQWAERFLAALSDAERGPGLLRRMLRTITGRK